MMRPKVTELLAGLNVHLMTHLHIIRIVHYILDHIFENGVTGEDWVYLGVHVLCLKEINTLLFIS
jgi:hypothetical protein